MSAGTSPSMSDIARKAGVAKSTVSLALRNDPRVVKAQREEIQKVARAMGYRTNALVARLMAELRSSNKQPYVATLALINASRLKLLSSRISTAMECTEGVRQRSESLGYTLDDFWLKEPETNPQRLARILDARNIKGVIFFGIWDDSDLQRSQPIWTRFPSVVVGHHPKNPPLNFVANDHYWTGLEVCRRLVEAGYKRIGIVLDKWLDTLLEHRFIAGYRSGLGEENAQPHILFLEDPREYPRPEGKERFMKWIKQSRLDACICLNSFVLDWLRESGLRVPEDIGVAMLDLQSEFRGRVAGVFHTTIHEGLKAVDVVVGQIHRCESGIPPFQSGILLEGEWVPGPTIRTRKPSPRPRRKTRSP